MKYVRIARIARSVTVTNLGLSSAPARDKGFHGVINTNLAKAPDALAYVTNRSKWRIPIARRETRSSFSRPSPLSLFLSAAYTRTKHFQPRDQFRVRIVTRACSVRNRGPTKSKKCFVKRQESIVINEPKKEREGSGEEERERRENRNQRKMKRREFGI